MCINNIDIMWGPGVSLYIFIGKSVVGLRFYSFLIGYWGVILLNQVNWVG